MVPTYFKDGNCPFSLERRKTKRGIIVLKPGVPNDIQYLYTMIERIPVLPSTYAVYPELTEHRTSFKYPGSARLWRDKWGKKVVNEALRGLTTHMFFTFHYAELWPWAPFERNLKYPKKNLS